MRNDWRYCFSILHARLQYVEYMWPSSGFIIVGLSLNEITFPIGTCNNYIYFVQMRSTPAKFFIVVFSGEGNACLVKSAVPYTEDLSIEQSVRMLSAMHKLNPSAKGTQRDDSRLCAGQTLVCSALGLKVVVCIYLHIPSHRCVQTHTHMHTSTRTQAQYTNTHKKAHAPKHRHTRASVFMEYT